MKLALQLLLAGVAAGCGHPAAQPVSTAPVVSTTIALTPDEAQLWVVNPDADSVSVLDPTSRTRLAEIALGDTPPAVDADGRYEPHVKPRALAVAPGGDQVFIAGQTANAVLFVDVARRVVTRRVPVGAEPTAVVVAQDGGAIYVVARRAATVTRIDARTGAVTGMLSLGGEPWGASLSGDGRRLYVSQFLLGAGLVVVDTATFTVASTLALTSQPRAAGADKRTPNGVPRGVYAAVPRPGRADGELWLPHLLLAVDTAQPDLDFESTAFPTITVVPADGQSERRRLLFKPLGLPGGGAFSDSVSGPRAVAFTADGKLAVVADAQSEDLLVFDAESGNQLSLVRPLPGTFLEGLIIDRAGKRGFVDARNSHNVVVLALQPSDAIEPVKVDGDPIERLAADPMPDQLRLGQRLFYTANSAAYPITKNFWIACSTCHLEGGTDAVTWLFSTGPRDTPSNAGGAEHTGFLMRQALRNSISDYDKTIQIEQGGSFQRDDVTMQPLFAALTAFVNQAIPLPENPYRDASGALSPAQARGRDLFTARCASCHTGDWLTDSGAGNPTLDLAGGPILLHDVGTCVTGGAHPDRSTADDVLGHARTACDFDTPTLRGIFATAPYFHDGSAATLGDVLDRLSFSADLAADSKADLVAYLQTL